ncbi:Serine hydrolase FSH [Trypanosoma melophagium]|uniref:Serine hydrolase FSH n=1 Tax=Trypanosoma melophagium TaxID=715481 RepID=UPI003519E0A4|nr:Serine hydrolase FSH [Trypanosoma melophagium]
MLKVLCLHGSRQTAEIFEHQLSKMCSSLADIAQFDFIDAPCLSEIEGDAVATYSWCEPHHQYPYQEEDRNKKQESKVNIGIDESYAAGDAVVRECMISERGPYDIILGFSQGALIAARYLMLQQLREDNTYGSSLKGIIMAASPDPRRTFLELSTLYQSNSVHNIDTGGFFGTLPSLHIVGKKDTIVSPTECISFANACQPNADIVFHEHAHSIPQLQSIITSVRSFLERCLGVKREIESTMGGEVIISAECEEELEMVSSMYGEGCVQRSPIPVVLLPLLLDCSIEDEVAKNISALRLRMTLPQTYPEELPKLDIVGGPSNRHVLFERWKTELLNKTLAYLRDDLGIATAMLLPAMMFASEQAGNAMEFLRSVFSEKFHPSGAANRLAAEKQNKEYNHQEEEEEEKKIMWWDEEEDEETRMMHIAEAERFAEQIIASKSSMETIEEQSALFNHDHDHNKDDVGTNMNVHWDAGHDILSRGGLLELTIGLIGKPSAGKSTFFNAVTDPQSELTAARVAAFPFTTITPNIGVGLCPLRCPCGVLSTNTTNNDINTTNINVCDAAFGHVKIAGHHYRRRRVVLTDVAGLVRGAYAGRGRGNQFLHDLCSATVLIHVVDGAGCTDADGVACAAGVGSTQDDIAWVRAEVHSWIHDNLRARWATLIRKPEKLRSMFTGYRSPPSFVDGILRRLGITDEVTLIQQLPMWGAAELHRLVALYVRVRFPIVVALNKADVRPEAGIMLRELKKRYPHEMFVPMSAKMECNLLRLRQKGLLHHVSGDSSFEELNNNNNNTKTMEPADAKALEELKQYFTPETLSSISHSHSSNSAITTGVQEVLAAALSCCPAVFVYPVSSFTLPLSSLKECFVFKQGTTAGDVFDFLLHTNLLDGKLVRFEAINVDDLRKGYEATPLKKETVLPGRHIIVRVLTNKRQMVF